VTRRVTRICLAGGRSGDERLPHSQTAVPSRESRSAKNADGRNVTTAALVRLSAGSTVGKRHLTLSQRAACDKTVLSDWGRLQGKRLPRDLFPCLFSHSAHSPILRSAVPRLPELVTIDL
jgi:hypothetical protein